MEARRTLTHESDRFFRVPECGTCLMTMAACMLSLVTINASAQNLDSLQKRYVAMKYGMFLHFNMGTFTGEEWATPNGDPNLFQPDSLNCGQWANAAVAGGMKYMVLTVKHHDGFCLWPSAVTIYDVASSSWRAGKGDVVKEFTDSCRSRGLAAGLYFSIWDRTHDRNADPLDPATDGDTTYIKDQLTELLTKYGPITALWFDGWGWQIPFTMVPYETIRKLVKSIQPNCLIVNNDQNHDLVTSEIVEFERYESISNTNTMPGEVCETIITNGNWFFPGSVAAGDLLSVASIVDLRNGCNSRNANLLLDATPDKHGRIPAAEVQRLIESKPAATGARNARPGALTIRSPINQAAAGKIFDPRGRLVDKMPATTCKRNAPAVYVCRLTASGRQDGPAGNIRVVIDK